jgi:SAM-dependent methyltransferase
MDAYQISRQQVFAPYVQKHSRGIEIGPGYRPTFPKSDGYAVTVVDHCPTAELIAKYEADITIPKELVRQIEAVDVVWTEGSYRDLPGLGGGFDYIAASHVIEHATDVCGFLADCSSLLKEGGYLLLAIPDRSCVLDYYRPASTVGDVLLAHLLPQAYDLKSQMDEVWYGALLDGGGAWSMAHLRLATGEGRVPMAQHPPSLAGQVWAEAPLHLAHTASKARYRDAHRWVFDPVSFKEIAGFLAVNASTGLTLEAMPDSFECEFYAVLRKESGSASMNAKSLESIRPEALSARRLTPPISAP